MTIIWNEKKLLQHIDTIIEVISKEGAEWVAKDAKAILMKKAKHPTGELAGSIKVKKQANGWWRVQAQGPGDYERFYAIHVETGTSKMKKIPYLRPALRINKRKIFNAYKGKLK